MPGRFKRVGNRIMRGPKNLGKEFKAFAMRGNVIELAIGVVIGTAFNSIVTSIVNNIVNPIIGLLGANNLENLYAPLKGYNGQTYPNPAAANASGIVTMNYGAVISAIISFIIVTLFCFLVTKVIFIDLDPTSSHTEAKKGRS
eukprot:NODE_73_length_24441_cov_0.672952.p18 type:complete len:143 gc:universal NODE_73_length_24441_cov_0.672952:12996-12568(-)